MLVIQKRLLILYWRWADLLTVRGVFLQIVISVKEFSPLTSAGFVSGHRSSWGGKGYVAI